MRFGNFVLWAAFFAVLAPPSAVDKLTGGSAVRFANAASMNSSPTVTLAALSASNQSCYGPLVSRFSWSLTDIAGYYTRVRLVDIVVTPSSAKANCTRTGQPQPYYDTTNSDSGTLIVTCTGRFLSSEASPTVTVKLEVAKDRRWIGSTSTATLPLDPYYADVAYAARLATPSTRGYVKCFRVDDPDIGNSCVDTSVWGYMVPPPRSTGVQADILLRPADNLCSTPSPVVGTANVACATNSKGNITQLTLTVVKNPTYSFPNAIYYMGCTPNYIRNCSTLDEAITPKCLDDLKGIGSVVGGVVRKTCGGAIPPSGVVTINVDPSKAPETGCLSCTNLWWAVKATGSGQIC